MPSCYFCDKEMTTTKQCANCRHAVYCSKDCQKKHWSKHKPNCVRSDHSIHGLFDFCSSDFLPDPGSTVARDYGFDNVRVNHGETLGHFVYTMFGGKYINWPVPVHKEGRGVS